MERREKLQKPVLRTVRVLMLVREKILIFFLELQKKLFASFKRAHYLRYHVFIIVESFSQKLFFVFPIDAGKSGAPFNLLQNPRVFPFYCALMRSAFMAKVGGAQKFLLLAFHEEG